MSQWQDRFLGIPDLPAELNEYEVEFFRFSDQEIWAIKTAFRTKFWIPAALQLGFMRMTGARLEAFKVLPRDLLRIVGEQLDQTPPSIATLRTLYKRDNTRWEHQSWVMKRLKITTHNKRQERMLLAAVREASNGTSSIDRLLGVARQWLFDRSFLIPSAGTLRDICERASNHTEASIYQAICKEVPSSTRTKWFDVLMAVRKDSRTTLEWLQSAPKKRSPNNLKDLFSKIKFLTDLGVADIKLSSVTIERQTIYAKQLQHRRPARFARLTEVTRSLQMVCFLKHALGEVTDVVVHLAGKATSDIYSKASKSVHKGQPETVAKYRDLVRHMLDIVNNKELNIEAMRTELLDAVEALAPTVFANHASAVRAQLTTHVTAVRPLLRKLVELNIKGLEGDRALKGLHQLAELYERKVDELPDGDYDCAKGWKPFLEDKTDRKRALCAFEASTLTELRRSFRRASCWIDSSTYYRDRDQILIPPAIWKTQRRRHYSMLRLPEDPKNFITRLEKAAEDGLIAVANEVRLGSLNIIDKNISLPKDPAEDQPPKVAEARKAISGEIGDIQFPELMLEMDALTHFSRTLLGRTPQNERELLLAYAGVLAHGTEMDATGVALMVPGLKAIDISTSMKNLEFDNAIDKASKVVLDFIGRLSISKVWGDGKSASSDMMALATSKHLWNSRLDPRRGVPSIGMYGHVHDQWPMLNQMPVVLGNRQDGAAIEGVMRQSLDLDWLSVDTHGYSDVGMAIAKLLGFDLCPRLKNLNERRLTIPRGMKIPEELSEVVDANLNLDCPIEHWDEIVRIAASINNGTANAVLVLERFGAVARGDPIYHAAKHLGRLIRTIYLCNFFTKPDFRREVHRVLNRGESVHFLERAIHFGEVQHSRGRRNDEMVAISSSLGLLTNLVIGWNSYKTQQALNALAGRGFEYKDEVIRHISPARYANINFRGTFDFPLNRYKERLLASIDRAA